jgi:hypothetical protein
MKQNSVLAPSIISSSVGLVRAFSSKSASLCWLLSSSGTTTWFYCAHYPFFHPDEERSQHRCFGGKDRAVVDGDCVQHSGCNFRPLRASCTTIIVMWRKSTEPGMEFPHIPGYVACGRSVWTIY